jgi:hypothetical protein
VSIFKSTARRPKNSLHNLKQKRLNAKIEAERRQAAHVPHSIEALSAMSPANRAKARLTNAHTKANMIALGANHLQRYVEITTQNGTRIESYQDSHLTTHALNPHPDHLTPTQLRHATPDQKAAHLAQLKLSYQNPKYLAAKAAIGNIQRNTQRQLVRLEQKRLADLADATTTTTNPQPSQCIFAPKQTVKVRGKTHRVLDIAFNTSKLPEIIAARAAMSSDDRAKAKHLPPSCGHHLCINPHHYPNPNQNTHQQGQPQW